MKKLLTVLCLAGGLSASAQTLFTYGKNAVSADEFLRAYQKAATGAADEKSLKEYLDLYIASRLKIAEARAKKLDTLPQLKTDLLNLRQQILPAYVNDKESLDRLIQESFERQQKDVHAAHIFIAFTKNGVTDTLAAAKRRDEVLAKLAKGFAFDDAARQYSDDPSALRNGGDLSWVTAFTLPYELESLLYATPVGKTSTPYASKAGIHIFKNLGDRKALGRMKAAQILLAFPPGADDATKHRLKQVADSLYNRLQKGDDFGTLATAFSNDVISAASNGQMQEFGVGEYSPAFEAAAFALATDATLSKPFETAHGYHIVKRIKLLPVPGKLDEATAADLRTKIETSDRMDVTRSILAQRIIKQTGYKNLLPSQNELWVYSDSALNSIQPPVKVSLTPASPLLKIGDRTRFVKDWIEFAQIRRYRTNGAIKTYPSLWDEFVQASALQYYEDHLENYNEEFKRQLNEFADGNLFFEIMQRQVWTPAQSDTMALRRYYAAHRDVYRWKQSADAVLFFGNDSAMTQAFYASLKEAPSRWKTLVNNYAEQVTADSGRFELSQVPHAGSEDVKAGVLTTVTQSQTDNNLSFAYVLRTYPAGEPRSFGDAKGLVINDYQAELEKAWLARLKKQYPVVVSQAVWKQVLTKAASQ